MWYGPPQTNNAEHYSGDTNPVNLLVYWILMAFAIFIQPILHCLHLVIRQLLWSIIELLRKFIKSKPFYESVHIVQSVTGKDRYQRLPAFHNHLYHPN